MRLIDADELIAFLKAVTVTNGITFNTGFKQILTDIQNQPTVDPEKHGRWIFATSDMSEKEIVDAIQDFIDHGGDPKMWRIDTHYCSGCLTGYHIYDDGFIVDGKGFYCPNCGAKLDEVSE